MNNKIMIFMTVAYLSAADFLRAMHDKYVFSPTQKNLQIIILGHNHTHNPPHEKAKNNRLVPCEERIMSYQPRPRKVFSRRLQKDIRTTPC